MKNECDIPNLAGIATKDLVETKGGGSFSASYINWARTLNMLRAHAPGWMVEAVEAPDGGIVFSAPVGGYLMMRLRHIEGMLTPAVPQAIMDNRNNSIPTGKISSRDVTDTHRRGACLVVAFHLGLAYELWAKDPMESGYHDGMPKQSDSPAEAPSSVHPLPSLSKELSKAMDEKVPDPDRAVGNVADAVERIKNCTTPEGAKKSMETSVWRYKFSSNDRSRLTAAVDYALDLLSKNGEREL